MTAASYLGRSGIEPNKQALRFDAPDDESSRELARDIQTRLGKEFKGTASIARGVRGGYYKHGYKDVSFIVLYRSDRLYKMRRSFDLKQDKINSLIYSNGLNIYFGFLRSLLGRRTAKPHSNVHARRRHQKIYSNEHVVEGQDQKDPAELVQCMETVPPIGAS